MKMKALVSLIVLFLLGSCSIKTGEDGVKIDAGDFGKIETSDSGVLIDGGDLGKIETGDDGVTIEAGNVEK